jgi:nicotinamidase-related amidase
MMIKATTAPGKTLLNANDHTLILIDYQPQMAFATASINGVALRNNVAIVANAAKAFAVSTILTTVSAESFSGPIFDEVRSALPSLKIIDRTSMNCWEDAAVVAEINRLGKSRIVIGGLWTSVCVADPVLSALDQDFDVYVITDACGDVSEEAHQRAIERMLQVGARPMTALQYLLELQRDWARTGTAGKTMSIVLPYGGSYGLGVVYAAKMIKAS